jgi:aspartyl-tRNA(Asn)/glutamyl-tRNA(Gln) amidotransferase subunit B
LALGCTVNHSSSFDRKHYFYKDLPSGYQITQQYSTAPLLYVGKRLTVDPLAVNGCVAVSKNDDSTGQLTSDFVLPITRIQIEQDTAKSTKLVVPINAPTHRTTKILKNSPLEKFLIDHNRSSIPLIEIITPPVLTSPHEAAIAFAKIAEVLRATGVTTGDLHLGAMRCDVNVSLGLGNRRTEIKNLFSVRAIRDSCTYEITQQIRQYSANEPIEQCTKTWDGIKTILLRLKEGEKDYRYLPDADLPPVLLNEEFIRLAREDLPPLVDYLVTILMGLPHGLNMQMARRLAKSPAELSYYNSVMEMGKVDGMTLCNWYTLHGAANSGWYII